MTLNIQPLTGISSDTRSFSFLQEQISSINFDGSFGREIVVKKIKDLIPGDIITTLDRQIAQVEQLKMVAFLDNVTVDGVSKYYLYYLNQENGERLQYIVGSSGEDYFYTGEEDIVVEIEDSSDFSVGTSGWAISKYGNAIFSNVALRGEIEATSGEISGELFIGPSMVLGAGKFLTNDNIDYYGMLVNQNNYFLSYSRETVPYQITSIVVVDTDSAESSTSRITLTLNNTGGLFTGSAEEPISLFGFRDELEFLNGISFVESVTSSSVSIIKEKAPEVTVTSFEVQPQAGILGTNQRINITGLTIEDSPSISINSATITASGHDYEYGMLVVISGITNPSLLNLNKEFAVSSSSGNTFIIKNVDATPGNYTTGLSGALVDNILLQEESSKFRTGSQLNYMSYDSQLDKLVVTGEINADSGNFAGYVTGGTSRFGAGVQTGKNGIWLNSTNYWYDDGTINAENGKIGGWTLGATELYSGSGETKVGIDAGNGKIYTGSGVWQNPNTGFYLDKDGKFSLRDKLVFDPGSTNSFGVLTINGRIRGAIENTPIDPTDSGIFYVGDIIVSGTAPDKTATFYTLDDSGNAIMHDFIVGDTVVVSYIPDTSDAAVLQGAWKITSINSTNKTFTVTSVLEAPFETIENGTYTDTFLTKTGSGSSGSNKITLDSSTGLELGQYVVATNVPIGTQISLIENLDVYLTANLTGSISSASIKFYGSAKVRELTMGLHPAKNGSPAGLGIRLDENNYWFVNNKFKIGASDKFVSWDGLELSVEGYINKLTIGRGGGDVESNFTVGRNALFNNTTGINNIALGESALFSNLTGSNNIAVGYQALYSSLQDRNIAFGDGSLYSNTTGIDNISVGSDSLYSNITGSNNISIGHNSLYSNTTGSNNISIGDTALYSNITGINNLGIGDRSLQSNQTGTNNLAIGHQALNKNKNSQNTAIGANSLYSNTSGTQNTAIGPESLYYNQTGSYNIAIGLDSLKNNKESSNVAIGVQALEYNTTGAQNLAIAYQSLQKNTVGSNNLAIGVLSLTSNTSGSFNLGIGYQALFSNTYGTNNFAIGYKALSSLVRGQDNLALGTNAASLHDGNSIIAIGNEALAANTSGEYNVAIGAFSMFTNTTGEVNLAIGAKSLAYNTSGSNNVAIGYRSLEFNTTGSYNVGIGQGSLYSNTTGEFNIAIGYQSLIDNIGGSTNLAIGWRSLYGNTEGIQNVAIGQASLYNNLNGQNNVAIGLNALYENTSGFDNSAVGIGSLSSNTYGNENTAYGNGSLALNTTGSYNLAIGTYALGNSKTGIANIAIGAGALANIAIDPVTFGPTAGGSRNIGIGLAAGSSFGTGDANVIIGGNDGSDIHGSSNNIILSDGDGNIRVKVNSSGVITKGNGAVIRGTTGNIGTTTSGTNLTVTHGLGTTPISVVATVRSNVYSAALNQNIFVGNFTATTFTVFSNNGAGGAAASAFSWIAVGG
jgi:hypothetical protein